MLECPKCGAQMVTRDRNGIMIDECGGCRGVYLDRGELELTTYQGRHRHGVVRQVFGEPDTNGQASNGGEALNFR